MSQYYHILHGTQRTFVPELAIYIICTVLEQGCRVLVDANRVRPSIYKVKVRPDTRSVVATCIYCKGSLYLNKYTMLLLEGQRCIIRHSLQILITWKINRMVPRQIQHSK